MLFTCLENEVPKLRIPRCMTKLSSGYAFTTLVKPDGTLFFSGVLGTDNTKRVLTFTRTGLAWFDPNWNTSYPDITNAKYVVCSPTYNYGRVNMVLASTGRVLIGTNNISSIGDSSLTITNGEGHALLHGRDQYNYSTVPLFIAVSTNYNSSLYLDGEGDVYAGGSYFSNTYNTITKVAALSDVRDILTRQGIVYVIKNDDTLWRATAFGAYTQVLTDVSKVVGTSTRTYALKNDGTVWRSYNTAAFTQELTDVIDIASDGDSALAVKSDNTLWGWGAGGSIGNGNSNTIITWTSYGIGFLTVFMNNASSFAYKTDGTLWATGTNTDGQLGLGDMANRTSWTQVTL